MVRSGQEPQPLSCLIASRPSPGSSQDTGSVSPCQRGQPRTLPGPALGQHPKPGLAGLRVPPHPWPWAALAPLWNTSFPARASSVRSAQEAPPSQAHPETSCHPLLATHPGQPLFPVWDTYGAKRDWKLGPVAHSTTQDHRPGCPVSPCSAWPRWAQFSGLLPFLTAWMSGTCGHAPPNSGVASSLDLS